MLNVTNLSTLNITVSIAVSTPTVVACHSSASVPPTTFPVPEQPDLLLGHFHDKRPFLLFLPAPETKQMWRQCLRKSVADIIYPKSSFGRASASGPSTRDVGHVGGLAASYTRTSTDSDSTLLSMCLLISSEPNRLGTDLFSLINLQQSV